LPFSFFEQAKSVKHENGPEYLAWDPAADGLPARRGMADIKRSSGLPGSKPECSAR